MADHFSLPTPSGSHWTRLLHDDLHWLTIPQRVQYMLAVTVHRCLWYRAPRYYLANCCVPVSEVSGCQHLRSAGRRKLNIPRFCRTTFWHVRAFSVTGPTVWNSLPDSLRDPAVEPERFSAGFENASLCRQTLEAWAYQRCYRSTESRCIINRHLLTFLYSEWLFNYRHWLSGMTDHVPTTKLRPFA